MNMQAPAFSVLSTPVALCDRRALSEAWYSALHMHKEHASSGASNAPAANRGTFATQAHVRGAVASGTADPTSLSAAVRVGAALALPGVPANDRRVSRTKLAEKIEQAFLRPKTPPKHASFALEGVRGRVQILLQQQGSQTQIVALCPPSAREVVARALSQARYALSLRGLSVQAEVRGFAR
ncbi:MAG: hypothetical protein ABR584_07060 [Candidatus Baltobacteraceae bacterium]